MHRSPGTPPDMQQHAAAAGCLSRQDAAAVCRSDCSQPAPAGAVCVRIDCSRVFITCLHCCVGADYHYRQATLMHRPAVLHVAWQRPKCSPTSLAASAPAAGTAPWLPQPSALSKPQAQHAHVPQCAHSMQPVPVSAPHSWSSNRKPTSGCHLMQGSWIISFFIV